MAAVVALRLGLALALGGFGKAWRSCRNEGQRSHGRKDGVSHDISPSLFVVTIAHWEVRQIHPNPLRIGLVVVSELGRRSGRPLSPAANLVS